MRPRRARLRSPGVDRAPVIDWYAWGVADRGSSKVVVRRRLDLLGCFVQLVSLVAAAASVPLIVSPLGAPGLLAPIAILAGAWIYARRRRHRYECATCGSPLPSKNVRVCPICEEPLA
jgi:hypothetical protein